MSYINPARCLMCTHVTAERDPEDQPRTTPTQWVCFCRKDRTKLPLIGVIHIWRGTGDMVPVSANCRFVFNVSYGELRGRKREDIPHHYRDFKEFSAAQLLGKDRDL